MVSIIVPIYNSESDLDRCISSILQQTYKQIQVILVNDGSTDSSECICDKYCLNDTRVLKVNKKNGGLSDARNEGLKHAQGEYVYFIDSDDYMAPTAISELVIIASEKGAEIVLSDPLYARGDVILEYSNGFLKNKVRLLTSEEAFAVLLNHEGLIGSPWTAWGKLYRKYLFDGVSFPVGRLSEDLATTPYLIARATKVAYSPKKTYYYCLREGSLIHAASEKLLYDNYYYAGKLRKFVLKNYPGLKGMAEIEYVWMCMLIAVNDNCSRSNILKELIRDIRKRSGIFMLSNRKLKYKLLVLLLTIAPNTTKQAYAKWK